MEKKTKYGIVALIVTVTALSSFFSVGYAIESYTFRQTTFEEGSECAELFITFQTTKPYDIFTKAPALMKFDKNCNTTGSFENEAKLQDFGLFAYALESNRTYFVDSKNVFFIVDVDSSKKTTLIKGGCVVSDEWMYFENIKIWRPASDGDSGRAFGKTTEGNLFYALFDITDDTAKVSCKVWHDGIKTRIVENGIVQNMFQ